jgi:hypothetical protein
MLPPNEHSIFFREYANFSNKEARFFVAENIEQAHQQTQIQMQKGN